MIISITSSAGVWCAGMIPNQHHHGQIVKLWSITGKLVNRRENCLLHSQSRAPQVCLDRGQEPLLVKELPVLIVRLGDTVGVEDQCVTRPELDGPGLPGDLIGDAKRYPGVAKLLRRGAVLHAQEVGRIVA